MATTTLPDSVVFTNLHPDHVSAPFFCSVMDFLDYDLHLYQRVIRGGKLLCQSGPHISLSRNALVNTFLERTDAPWMWMVDSDTGFAPDTLERLLATGKDVVSALYKGAAPMLDGKWDTFPCVLVDTGRKVGRWERMADVPREGMIDADANGYPLGVGAGCLLVHRRVLEAVGDKYAGTSPWFKEETEPELMGEDLVFCARVAECGYRVWLACGIEVDHYKLIAI